jgi:hypothetical protein
MQYVLGLFLTLLIIMGSLIGLGYLVTWIFNSPGIVGFIVVIILYYLVVETKHQT